MFQFRQERDMPGGVRYVRGVVEFAFSRHRFSIPDVDTIIMSLGVIYLVIEVLAVHAVIPALITVVMSQYPVVLAFFPLPVRGILVHNGVRYLWL